MREPEGRSDDTGTSPAGPIRRYRRVGLMHLAIGVVETVTLLALLMGSGVGVMLLVESAGFPRLGGIAFFAWIFGAGGAGYSLYSRRVTMYWHRFGYAKSCLLDADRLVDADLALARVSRSREPLILLLRSWSDSIPTDADAPRHHPGLSLASYERGGAVATNLPSLLADRVLATAAEVFGELERFAIHEPGTRFVRADAYQVSGIGRAWREMVVELIEQSAVILVLVVDHVSPQVRWELDRIVELGRTGQTLVIFAQPCRHFTFRSSRPDASIRRAFSWVLASDPPTAPAWDRAPPGIRTVALRLHEELACGAEAVGRDVDEPT